MEATKRTAATARRGPRGERGDVHELDGLRHRRLPVRTRRRRIFGPRGGGADGGEDSGGACGSAPARVVEGDDFIEAAAWLGEVAARATTEAVLEEADVPEEEISAALEPLKLVYPTDPPPRVIYVEYVVTLRGGENESPAELWARAVAIPRNRRASAVAANLMKATARDRGAGDRTGNQPQGDPRRARADAGGGAEGRDARGADLGGEGDGGGAREGGGEWPRVAPVVVTAVEEPKARGGGGSGGGSGGRSGSRGGVRARGGGGGGNRGGGGGGV